MGRGSSTSQASAGPRSQRGRTLSYRPRTDEERAQERLDSFIKQTQRLDLPRLRLVRSYGLSTGYLAYRVAEENGQIDYVSDNYQDEDYQYATHERTFI